MEPIAVVSVIVLLEYFGFSALAAAARAKAGIAAPATVGDPNFERHFRVQQNTLEQLIIFLPALWLFGYYVHPLWGAALGLVFVVGRFMYYRGYVADPVRRGRGFVVGEVAQGILLLGGLAGAIVSWAGR
jgi:glutathione S-transferase